MKRSRPVVAVASPLPIDLLPLMGLFAAGLVVREIHLFLFRHDFWMRTPLLDDSIFVSWSGVIGREGWLARSLGVFDLNPAYAYLLALMHGVGFESVLSVFALQHIVGACVPVLLFLLTRRIFDRKVAWVAGILGVFYGPAIFYEARCLGEFWIYFFNTAALTSLVLFSGTRRQAAAWTVAGLCLGMSAIFRPTILAFIPLVILWGCWDLWGRRTLLAGCLALFLGGVWLPMFPFQYRNHVVSPSFGWGLTTASGGVNLFLGNNPESDGLNQAPSFVHYGPAQEYLDFKEEAERRLGRPLSRPEVSSYWTHESWRWFCSHPRSAFYLWVCKAGYFWNEHEPPDNFFKDMFDRFTRFWKIPLVGWGVVAPLAMAGLFWGFLTRRDKTFWLLAGYGIFYFGINVAFYILSRYRFPSVAALIPLASWVLVLLNEQLQQRKLGHALALILLIGGGFAISRLELIGDEVPEISHYSMGVIYANQGLKDLAAAEYRASLQANPRFQASYLNLGILEAERGHTKEGIEALEGAWQWETVPSRKENIHRVLEELKRKQK